MPKPTVINNPYLLEAKRYRARRRFSQNFLISGPVLDGIVNCVDLAEDETVVEIGPGLGFLTQKLLLDAKRVVAVELEHGMITALKRKFEGNEQLELIEGDILAQDLTQLPEATFKVVGNLPYQITSKVLFKLAGELHETDHPLRQRISRMTVMVQKEVAERIVASCGTKAYSPLSIALQQWFKPELNFIVPANSFEPQPKVQSAVVTLTPRQAPLAPVKDAKRLSRMIRQAFQQRRKTLRNSLKGFEGCADTIAVFDTAGIDPGARPEQLSPQQLGCLADAFTDALA